MSGRACYPACHPERSEGALRPGNEILRCAQDDRPYLQMSEHTLIVVFGWRRGNDAKYTLQNIAISSILGYSLVSG